LTYYQAYVEQPAVARRYPTALSIDRDRDFALNLAAFVKQHLTSPNAKR
jgi:hypothetical protein